MYNSKFMWRWITRAQKQISLLPTEIVKHNNLLLIDFADFLQFYVLYMSTNTWKNTNVANFERLRGKLTLLCSKVAALQRAEKLYEDVIGLLPDKMYLREGYDRGMGQSWLADVFKSNDFSMFDFEDDGVIDAVGELQSMAEHLFPDTDTLDEWFEDNFGPITDAICQRDASTPEKDTLRASGNLNVRVLLHSNYDCINSHAFEGGYRYVDSYYGDAIDILQLNPAEVKRALVSCGVPCAGRWPNKPKRVPYVDTGKFVSETLDRCAPVCLLTFLGTLDLWEYLGNGVKEFVIPAGNKVGFYSDDHGGGSPMDMELLRDFTFTNGAPLGTEYDSLDLVPDEVTGYSVRDCFGVYNSFFGDELTIVKELL